jgi:predicted DsbA family dithiol-disulfide isomerase
MTLTVDVISDVICPWCYVGKRRLEKAVRALGGRHEVRVRWHPFQLNPQMPKEGMDRQDYRAAKFGSWERSLALDAQMKEVGADEGIAFDFARMARTPNTLDAHRLIRLADEQGVQDAVVEALFQAYFTEGRDIGLRKTLLDVVAGAGLSPVRTEAVLDTSEGLDAVRAAEEQARQLGVQGVPFFLVNGELALSGAQKPEAFLAAFDRLTAPTTPGDGGACAVKSSDEPGC